MSMIIKIDSVTKGNVGTQPTQDSYAVYVGRNLRVSDHFSDPLAQAGSYDFDLIEQAAEMTAKECYQNGLHVIFSPMLDLVRDPRWGG